MLRHRSLCALGTLGFALWGTSGCFGLVEYDEDVGMGHAGAAAGGGPGTIPTDKPVVVPVEMPLATGGHAGVGGQPGPVVPPLRPLPTEPPACSVDCCSERLVQMTGASGPLDADALRPYLSGDGAWVVFSSRASTLPGANVAGFEDVYLASLAEGTTLRVAPQAGRMPSGDTEANAISADGRFVLLTSNSDHWTPTDQNGTSDVFLYDRDSGEVTLLSRGLGGGAGNGRSLGRDLSPDGRYAVYSSVAADLTPGDDNDAWDVFVWDRQTGATERVSMGPGDQQRNPVSGNHAHVSADGRFVSFHSQSDQLVPAADGGSFDVFLVDRQLGITTKVSQAPSGTATDGDTFVLGMSDDARFLASYGGATNLVLGDTNGQSDVFLFDRVLGRTSRVNLGPAGEEAEVGTTNVSLSHDGRWLGFASASARLAQSAAYIAAQSYVYDVGRAALARISRGPSGELGNGHSQPAEFSASGRCLVLGSRASNLTPASLDDGVSDVFVGRTPTAP